MAKQETGSQGLGVRGQDAASPAESPDTAVEDPVVAFARASGERIAEHYRRQCVTIEVPIGPLGDGHQARHVDAQLRTAEQQACLRRIFTGLDLTGARTRNDKRVTNNVEAVLWLLEQVAAAIGEQLRVES